MTVHHQDQNLTLADRSKMLLDLILNAERDTQSWIKFLLTIESATAAAFAYLIKEMSSQFPQNAPLVITVCALFSAAGIAGALIVGSVVMRQRKWHSWYIRKFNELPTLAGTVFANQAGVIEKMPRGFVARRVRELQIGLVICWLVVVGFAMWTFAHIR